MDDKDQQIAQLLSEDAWMTYGRIGEVVHLSASAVQRRVAALKKRGVITGARATLDKSGLGKRLRIYLLLELREDNARALDELVENLGHHLEVSGVELLAGKFDVLLTLDCEDTEQFSDMAMRVINTNPNVLHCWTLTRIRSLV